MATATRRSPSTAPDPSPAGGRAPALVAVGVTGLVVVLVAAASRGPLPAALALGVAAILLGVAAVGTERLGTAFVVAALFAAPMNDGLRISSNITVVDLCFVVGFALLLPRLLAGRIALPASYGVGMVVVVALGCLSSLASPDPAASFQPLLFFVVAAGLLPVAYGLWGPSPRVVEVLAGAYVAGQVFNTLAALVIGPLDNNRYSGLTPHANFLGNGGALAVALLLFLHPRVPRGRRWLVWLAGLVCLGSTLMSGSRADVIVVVVLALAYPAVTRRQVQGYTIVGLSVVAALLLNAVLAALGTTTAVARLMGNRSTDASNAAREGGLSQGWDQFVGHPWLGSGFAGYFGVHNVYLEVAAAIGAVGLVGYLAVQWSFVRRLFWAGDLRLLALGPLAYVVLALMVPSLYDRSVWAVVGLAVLIPAPPDQQRR